MDGIEAGHGQIHAILGPMFAGKTTELLRMMDRYSRMKHASVILFKTRRDTRHAASIVRSHDGISRPAEEVISTGPEMVDKILARKDSLCSTVVIGIDEAQIAENLRSFAEFAVDHRVVLPEHRIVVFMSALDGTFLRTIWKEIAEVLPLCTTFRKLDGAVCMCCERLSAVFSRRDSDDQELLVIGGEDLYSAVCSACYEHKKSSGGCPSNRDGGAGGVLVAVHPTESM